MNTFFLCVYIKHIHDFLYDSFPQYLYIHRYTVIHMGTIGSKAQALRKARLHMVLNMIKVMREIEYMKLIGLLSVEHGFKETTSRSYLKDLKNAECIQVKNGLITLTESYKKQIGLIEKAEIELNDYDKKLQRAEAS